LIDLLYLTHPQAAKQAAKITDILGKNPEMKLCAPEHLFGQ
jgi:hypothetical protein